ncbi:hypothetical protein IWW42_001178 [Coemansia sp. RSA 1085]|nr:hypothetical protein IWW42_001178 [Coemansia sp. RSA 1085]
MRKFTALYTHQKLKKSKTWQDGFAHYKQESHELVLYDSSHGLLANYRLRAKERIDLSNEYDMGRFLLTLEEEEDGEDKSEGPTEHISMALKKPVRRTKRPASLIKPIRLKKPPEAVDSSSATPTTNHPDKDKDDCIRYTALYTTQKVKKLKAWSDGEIAYTEGTNRITLKDSDGNTLTKAFISTYQQQTKIVPIN